MSRRFFETASRVAEPAVAAQQAAVIWKFLERCLVDSLLLLLAIAAVAERLAQIHVGIQPERRGRAYIWRRFASGTRSTWAARLPSKDASGPG